MFLTNHRISGRQVKRMLILDMFSISLLITPYIAVRGNAEKGFLSVLIGCILAVGYGSIIYCCGRDVKDESYMSYSRQSIGKIGTIVLGGLYFVKFLMVYMFAITLFIYIIGHTLLMNTNPQIILITLLLMSAYGGMQGLEKKARFSEIIYYIVLTPILIYLLLGIHRVDISNLMMPGMDSRQIGEELFIKSENNLMWSSYITLLPYIALETMLFVLPMYNKGKQKRGVYPYVLWSILIIGLLNIFIYCITVGILGVGETGNTLWGTVTIMTLIELPGNVLNRQDGIMLAFWLLSIYTLLSAYWFYMTDVIEEIIQCVVGMFSRKCSSVNAAKRNNRKPIIGIFLLISIYIGYGTIENIQEAFIMFGEYFAYIGVPQSIILPILVLLVYKIRTKNKGTILKEEKTV